MQLSKTEETEYIVVFKTGFPSRTKRYSKLEGERTSPQLNQLTATNSTSNTSHEFGGIFPSRLCP